MSNAASLAQPRMLTGPDGTLAHRILQMWPIVLVFIHLSFFRIAGFEVTVAVLFCAAAIPVVLTCARIHQTQLTFATAALAYTLALGLFAHDFGEYLRSLLLVLNLGLMLLAAMSLPLPDLRALDRSTTVFLRLAAVVALFVIAQAVAMNVLRSDALLNPFGKLSMLGPGGRVYEPSPLAGLRRPNGIFSEPSVAGWYLAFAGAVALSARTTRVRSNSRVAALCFLAALATFSLAGLVNVVAVVAAYIWVAGSRRVPRGRVVLLALAMVTAAFAAGSILGFSARTGELAVEGTSVYYRITAPLQLVAESLPKFPFGHPLGQTDYIVSKNYMINWLEGSTTNIDNTFLLISYYYGFPGLLLGAVILGWAGRLVVRRSSAAPLVAAVVLALSETGAGWSPGFAVLLGFTTLLLRAKHTTEFPAEGRAQSGR